MGLGAAAGASGTVWAQRRVRGAIEDLGAEQVVAVAGRGARAAARAVVSAVGEAREAMSERELELRSRLHGTDASVDLRHRHLRPVPQRVRGR